VTSSDEIDSVIFLEKSTAYFDNLYTTKNSEYSNFTVCAVRKSVRSEWKYYILAWDWVYCWTTRHFVS